MTPEQSALLSAIAAALEADPEIQAAWLGGSLGRGAGDAFSDVDLVALTEAGAAARVGQRYAAEDAGRIAPAVLVNALFGGRVVNVVTEDWRRFDIAFVEPGELCRYAARDLTPLFNRGDLGPPDVAPAPYVTAPETLRAHVNEFLRILGLLVVAAGREEWTLAMTGTEMLRRLTLEVMLEENGVGPAARGGALRRNPLLDEAQRAELAGLSPIGPDRDSVIAANVQIAAIFLPRARRLAQRIGMAWPEAFEAATRRSLRARLGIAI